MTLWHHWGHHRGCWILSVMPPVTGAVTDAPYDHKTTLNIDIYPSTLGFFENIGHKYDFDGGGVVPGRVWGGGMVHIQIKKVLTEY